MADMVELFLGDMKCALYRFEPKPGDLFVLTFPGHISLEDATRIKSYWENNWPDNKLGVIADGAKIELVSGESAD